MQDKPRLSYAIQNFDQTGPMRAPYQICKAFMESGWQVDIQTLESQDNENMMLAWNQVPIKKITGSKRRFKIVKLVASFIRKRKRHVVISFIWEWQCYGLMLAKWLFGSPYVLALDTYTHRSGKLPRSRFWEEIRYGPQLRNADMILAECPSAYEAAKRFTQKAIVLQVPFCLWQKDLEFIEAEWDLRGFQPQREKVILYAGRLVERKHVDDLINAFASLADDFPDWVLEVRGLPASDAYGKRIKELVTQIDCADRICFLPGVSGEALYRRYRETSIFALPSEGEGMPTTITEAMYFGGAIVAGISGAIKYQLDNGRCGCLHDASDLKALTDHLQTLMSSESLRETYMTRARARMLSLFVWERYFPELEIQFQQLVEK